jgi:hypothetical protein
MNVSGWLLLLSFHTLPPSCLVPISLLFATKFSVDVVGGVKERRVKQVKSLVDMGKRCGL